MKRARVWIKVETFDDEGGPSKEYTVPCRDLAEFDHYQHAASFCVDLAKAARRLGVDYRGAVVHNDSEESRNHEVIAASKAWYVADALHELDKRIHRLERGRRVQ